MKVRQTNRIKRGPFFKTERLNSNNTYQKIQSIYYRAYLNRSLMHPRCVHSYAHPMDCVDNLQWNLHLPDTEHRPAKSFHFLDQTVHCVEHWQQTNTQVDDRQLEHHLYPNYRHKQFPRYHCNRSPLCPLQANFLQSVSKLLVYKLEVNSYLGFEKQLYFPICYPVMHTEYFKWKTSPFCVICRELLQRYSTEVCKEIRVCCEM